jgi:myo-inositol-1-phosphate synthase
VSAPPASLGVFLVGASGSVATTVVAGAAAVARGIAPRTGMVTALSELERDTALVPLEALVFGGADVRDGDLEAEARRLADEGVLAPGLALSVADVLMDTSARVAAGTLLGSSEAVRDMAGPATKAYASETPREALERMRAEIRRLRDEVAGGPVVVVHLASVEPRCPGAELLETEDALEAYLDEARPDTPASLIYALAAIDEGCPYVNFTPAVGASAPALVARSKRLGVPTAGRDGKTGETLLKSVLAPMFRARNLRVLSWAGYNILGNRDGAVLADPASRESKLSTKGSVLTGILPEGQPGSEHVTIEYVPSLGDRKTAWDHVHFEGFLGVPMQLELTWRGCDSALAAPLVLDCVRLIERAARAGHAGPVPGLACFFKQPDGTDEQAFDAQWRTLLHMAEAFRTGAR